MTTTTRKRHAVTGAFGYSGKYIAARLNERGYDVITLTNSLDKPNPFGNQITAHPFNFDKPTRLVDTLRGVDVLYNTYWVRFNHDAFTFAMAVANSRALFEAARNAGVRRVVHISITNANTSLPLPYFNGKAEVERMLIESGLSYAILRPAVLFGKEDILINNIAWMLRRLPVFGVFGDGRYRLQPIYVDDLAQLAVEQGQRSENAIIDAIGPETFTYRELVKTIGELIGHPRPVINVSPAVGYWIGRTVGRLKGDVTITRDEITGLMAGLLAVDAPPAGETRLTEWIAQHRDMLGAHYANELQRRVL